MVKIYSTDTCASCHQTKKLYDTLKIEYTEHNITRDPEAMAEYNELAGNSVKTVPLTTDGTRVVFGYNVPQLISLGKSA